MSASVASPSSAGRWERLRSLGFGPHIIALLLVLGLVGAMAIEPTRQLLEQRGRIAAMNEDLQEVRRSNERLEGRIGRLSDPDFLEQRARDIGLVRPGETAYVVMPPSRSQLRSQRARRPQPAPAPAEPSFLEGFLTFLGVR